MGAIEAVAPKALAFLQARGDLDSVFGRVIDHRAQQLAEERARRQAYVDEHADDPTVAFWVADYRHMIEAEEEVG